MRNPFKYQSFETPFNQRPKAIRVVIADAQPIFRRGLRGVIETQSDLRVVGETADGAEAVRLVQKHAPGILLLDLAVSGLDALQVLRNVQGSASQVRGIILAAEIETRDAREALRLGARAAMRKDSPPDLLLKGIRDVIAGKGPVRENSPHFPAWPESLVADRLSRNHFRLTSRELQIVSAIVEGETNKAIAERLGVSGNTVRHHLTSIFDKLGVGNRLELAIFAMRVLPDQRTTAQWRA